ncbi:MAG: MCE family protein [Solirubrobacterales bacterium]|nr:MCE family protein [Solirubrobacterales bacterium]
MVLFSLSCIGLIIFVWVAFGGTVPLSAKGYQIKALFKETGQLVPNADVRISGVNVGKVAAVQAQGRNSLVTMDLNEQYSPIPKDTRAILRQKTLLGEGYVDLSTGDGGSAKLPDGGTLPPGHIAQTQQLDQVLNDFTPPVQADLQRLLAGTAKGLNGRGQDLNDALGNFGPASSELQQLADVLNGQSGNIKGLINNASTVLHSVSARGSQLDTLINSGNQVLSTTAAEDHNVTATVNALPAFLTQVRSTLNQVNSTLAVAKPSLDALKPVTPIVAPALENLNSLSGPLVNLLQTAPGVLRNANKDVPAITTFLNELPGVTKPLVPVTNNVIPMVDLISKYRQQMVTGMSDLAASSEATAPASTTSNALGFPAGQANYLRALITLGSDSVFGATHKNPSVRTNAYPAPGQLSRVGNGGYQASSCSGTGGGNIPCQLQPKYDWGSTAGSSYYPRLSASKNAK